jgi:hypothetical protein
MNPCHELTIIQAERFGRRPLGRRRFRREDNITINLKEIGWEAWTELIWLRAGQLAVSSIRLWECAIVFS